MCACECVRAHGSDARVFSYSPPAPPLANDRCNKTFVKDEAIHHVVQGHDKNPGWLKSTNKSPRAQGMERQREGWGG